MDSDSFPRCCPRAAAGKRTATPLRRRSGSPSWTQPPSPSPSPGSSRSRTLASSSTSPKRPWTGTRTWSGKSNQQSLEEHSINGASELAHELSLYTFYWKTNCNLIQHYGMYLALFVGILVDLCLALYSVATFNLMFWCWCLLCFLTGSRMSRSHRSSRRGWRCKAQPSLQY